MLQFRQSDTSAILILTLTEKVSINEPNYLFVFTHVTTKEQVKFIKAEGADESTYPSRYNQFTINASVVFDSRPVGEWHYKVYEQQSETNLDEDLAGAELENGKLIIERSEDFEFDKYNEPQSFKVYNG
ncbi:MAG: hypothetical protein QM791_04085 [Ferruginibacter sp.]